jgi:hypothetical protein
MPQVAALSLAGGVVSSRGVVATGRVIPVSSSSAAQHQPTLLLLLRSDDDDAHPSRTSAVTPPTVDSCAVATTESTSTPCTPFVAAVALLLVPNVFGYSKQHYLQHELLIMYE